MIIFCLISSAFVSRMPVSLSDIDSCKKLWCLSRFIVTHYERN